MSGDSKKEFVVYYDSKKFLIMAVLCLSAVPAMYFVSRMAASEPMLVWCSIFVGVFFGGCGLYGLVSSLDKRPKLIINGKGIQDLLKGSGLIDWDEIEEIGVEEVKAPSLIRDHVVTRYLQIKLKDPKTFAKRLNPIGRFTSLSSSVWTIDFSFYDAGARDAVAFMQKLRRFAFRFR